MPTLNERIAAENWARAHGQAYDGYGFLVPGMNPAAMGRAPSGGGAGTLTGAAPGGYSPASGGIPGVTSPAVSMDNLIESINKSLPAISDIMSRDTGASSKALRDQYSPDYFTLLDSVTANANKRAKGDISDLIYGLSQDAAERAVASGVAGSDAYNTKLLRDLGLTRYQVEQEALNSLGRIKDATPTVAPFNIHSLIPTVKDFIDAQGRADTLAPAPVPEQAFQRALQLAMAGLARGQNAGYGRGFNAPGGGGGGSGSWFEGISADNGSSREIAQRYATPGGPIQPAAPGWGQAWNNQGGSASVGDVPMAGNDEYFDIFSDDFWPTNPAPPGGQAPMEYMATDFAPAGYGGGDDWDEDLW